MRFQIRCQEYATRHLALSRQQASAIKARCKGKRASRSSARSPVDIGLAKALANAASSLDAPFWPKWLSPGGSFRFISVGVALAQASSMGPAKANLSGILASRLY